MQALSLVALVVDGWLAGWLAGAASVVAGGFGCR